MIKNRQKKLTLYICSIILFVLLVLALLFYFGVLHLNNPSTKAYPVKGVDVSSYQGEVDWDTLSEQNISFAYIKATEGSSYIDDRFEYNWKNASGCNLRIGAYHFFSFESSGEAQAKHFINTVTAIDNMLPPVIDVEYYGRFHTNEDIVVPDVVKELRNMVDVLTETYGMKPIIYVSKETYKTIVQGNFDDCKLWYRSVYSGVPNDVEWTFWQYSNRHRLKGYNGSERYIDMNVFNGSADDFFKE